MQQSRLKLSLGPVLFFWPKQQILDFYQQMAEQPLQTIYLGETVCSRRQELKLADWIALAKDLATTGKEIILSSQVLLESESDLKRLRKLIEQDDFKLEANDLAAVKLFNNKQKSFVAGSTLNIYNEQTLAFMQSLGASRWVTPLEMSADSLRKIIIASQGIGCEVFAWGKLPLAYSSRCFTARRYNLKKDNCQFKCMEHPDGIDLQTREHQSFLTINGIQTMSSACYSLIANYNALLDMGISILRLSPQCNHMVDIIQIHELVLTENLGYNTALKELSLLAEGPLADGYWQGKAGITNSQEIVHADT